MKKKIRRDTSWNIFLLWNLAICWLSSMHADSSNGYCFPPLYMENGHDIVYMYLRLCVCVYIILCVDALDNAFEYVNIKIKLR